MSEQQVQEIYRVTEDGIYGFFKEHRFLSNSHECPVEFEEKIYLSSEAAYMAAKTLDLGAREMLQNLEAKEAKTFGRKVSLRDNWEHPVESPWPVIELFKDEVMYKVCMDKFTRDQSLHNLLLATGNKYLEETNWWKDQYWGVYNKVGKNKLGRILMLIRSQLK